VATSRPFCQRYLSLKKENRDHMPVDMQPRMMDLLRSERPNRLRQQVAQTMPASVWRQCHRPAPPWLVHSTCISKALEISVNKSSDDGFLDPRTRSVWNYASLRSLQPIALGGKNAPPSVISRHDKLGRSAVPSAWPGTDFRRHRLGVFRHGMETQVRGTEPISHFSEASADPSSCTSFFPHFDSACSRALLFLMW
jgi:hypothetical protein